MNTNWLYSIDIKLSDETSWKGVRELSESVIKALDKLIPIIEKSNIDEREYLSNRLDEIKNDFDFRLLDEQDDLMDEHNSTEECNYLLENLYDIADLKVTLNGIKRKFIWINK